MNHSRLALVSLGVLISCLAVIFFVAYIFIPEETKVLYVRVRATVTVSNVDELPPIVHIKTPKPLKAVYMTSYVAGSKQLREKLLKLIDDTEINAVVVDIKDYSGKISFVPNDPLLKSYNSFENRIPDLDFLLRDLKKRNVYTIGRIAAFQDTHMVKMFPELAVKRQDGKEVWRDRKGIPWIDPGAKNMWEYLHLVGKESYARGFDELNFDYIRFPSDGDMYDISYPFSATRTKREVMREFFAALRREFLPLRVPISADLFGMTTTNYDDLNIGQVLEDALPYFNYIAPMVYPSHYPTTFIGIKNPAEKPYEVVKYSMDKAFWRSSTTPDKMRPWLQDFDLGADYDAVKVRAQIQATYDAGFDSWMLWAPSNRYTTDALLKAEVGE